jgi:hypothetical protein
MLMMKMVTILIMMMMMLVSPTLPDKFQLSLIAEHSEWIVGRIDQRAT